MQSTRRSGAPPLGATVQRQTALYKHILFFLQPSPATALFFAERLYALDPSLEPSVFLLALALFSVGHRQHEVIWLLRQPVAFPTSVLEGLAGDHSLHHNNNNTAGRNRSTPVSFRPARPACESSLRCGRLYAAGCLQLGREKEGRDILGKLLQSGAPLIPPQLGSEVPALTCLFSEGDTWVLDLEMARLAKKAGEDENALESYRRVLDSNAFCWEALEGVCALGFPPDVDQMYPARQRPILPPLSPLQPVCKPPPPPPSLPLPLGPSQSSAVNSSGPSSTSKVRYGNVEGLGFFTPSDTASPTGIPASKAKVPYSRNWKKTMGHNISDITDASADESTSFSAMRFPMASYQLPLPVPLSYGQTTSAPPVTAISNRPTSVTPAPAPGVKRARGPTPAPALAASTVGEEDERAARRAVKGVPAAGSLKKSSSLGASSSEVRRSTRLSRETLSGGAGPATSSVALLPSANGKSRGQTINPREKKRSKSGAGLSVLSDGGSEIQSPRSPHSSSPVPSSPGATIHQVMDPAVHEAEDYIAQCMRCFAAAACYAAEYDSVGTLEALALLPAEQQKSWRCCVGVAKAHFELLNYDKAEKAFASARQNSPHLLESMELYSTLLWHLRRPIALSFLAQDLVSISPNSRAAWIASGNVFSQLDDHPAALKCFQRAAQLDVSCVYAYTLSGHECVVLEEWERALSFFRQAVKRDGRHYNAWFGLGNVYMQTGKYRLAEYHFRKAADINPTNAMLVCCVGSVLEKFGKRNEALEMYEKAFLLAPDSPAVRFKRVRVLIALKQYNLAESDLLTLKNTAPNEFNVNFLLGKLYILLGRRTDAVKYFTFAQDLEPRNGAAVREQLEICAGDDTDGGMEVDGESQSRS